MPFKDAKPAEVFKPNTSGISVSLRGTDGRILRITMNAAVQEKTFGGSVIGKRFKVMQGTDADKGKVRIQIDEAGPFELVSSMKGSGAMSVEAWGDLPKKTCKALQAEVVESDAKSLTIQLPDFGAAPESVGQGREAVPAKSRPFDAKRDVPKRSAMSLEDADTALKRAVRG